MALATAERRNILPSAFALTPDQQAILDTASDFSRETFLPLQQKMDDEEWWPPQAMPALASMGFLGVTVPEDLGGSGSDFFSSGLITQGLARYNPAIALSYIAHENLCLNNIARNASEAVKKRFVPGLCDGSKIGALGLTEPGAGSDALGSMATTARRDGDHYVLNGRKLYITNGPVADIVLVYAKTDKAKGAKGISAFIVEKGTPGFAVAQKLDKMGFRGSVTAELTFDDCRVPAENMVGEENRGVAVVMSGLDLERAIVALINVGMAERALELSIDYAKTRQQFGRRIGDFQMVQAKLADMYTQIEAMKALCYRTLAFANDLGEGDGGRGEIHKVTAAALMFAADNCSRVISDALQIFGGSGYMRETEVNRLYRASKLLEIGAGTTEIRKLIIAGELMRD
ncbi:acyl-CoA dehydrogenase family protein [Phreatobacter oligotrophus]|jgi:isovaleryl-CoA dehydrogenase|uniref:acyl-CoA dehydrogenase family protein n=2 Tax=Pseudomonadota TaxID=1224 RepID=UPI002356E1C1|nr:acyl-CoA dehydrogenase family protein [Phreatobacter oligotrophus]MBX9990121.1 acyl-CoA dehydrogenase family protein [Phreatobacter oligotrophus]